LPPLAGTFESFLVKQKQLDPLLGHFVFTMAPSFVEVTGFLFCRSITMARIDLILLENGLAK
jgi:hypothetical protein